MVKVIKMENEVECETCKEILAYEDSDIIYGAFGCGKILCPTCGEWVYLDDKYIELTEDNIQYPEHFFKAENAVDLADDEIKEYIKEAIAYLRTHEDEIYMSISIGNAFIMATRKDDFYNIYVGKNGEESAIKI